MRFSEAMRLGAMWRPQAFFRLFDPITGGTCANGAAAEAIGFMVITPGERYPGYPGAWPQAWSWISHDMTTCPVCARADEVSVTVVHLNNLHRWTREAIADWVATIEPVESPAVVPEEAAKASK